MYWAAIAHVRKRLLSAGNIDRIDNS